MARIPYVDKEDMPEEYRSLLDSTHPRSDLPEEYSFLMSGDTRNFYRLIGHAPPVLEAFKELAARLWDVGEMDAYRHELVTLTVSRELGSAYEWNQRVRISLDEGFSPAEILAVGERRLEEFDPADAALIEYTAAVVNREVDDAIHARMAEHFDEETIVGVGMLIGVYTLIDYVALALDVDLEEPFVGWDLESEQRLHDD